MKGSYFTCQIKYLTAVDRVLEAFPEPHVMVRVEVSQEVYQTAWDGPIPESIHCEGGTCIIMQDHHTHTYLYNYAGPSYPYLPV
jgi:hypothetical protein